MEFKQKAFAVQRILGRALAGWPPGWPPLAMTVSFSRLRFFCSAVIFTGSRFGSGRTSGPAGAQGTGELHLPAIGGHSVRVCPTAGANRPICGHGCRLGLIVPSWATTSCAHQQTRAPHSTTAADPRQNQNARYRLRAAVTVDHYRRICIKSTCRFHFLAKFSIKSGVTGTVRYLRAD